MNSAPRNATSATRTKLRDLEQTSARDETLLVAAVDRLLLLVGSALATVVIYIMLSQ
jgi:hypothetical protein